MKKKLKKIKTNRASEKLLGQDLSPYIHQENFKPMRFELKPKNETVTIRMSEEFFKFDRQVCKKFKLTEHFDKEKLFSFMDRTGVEYNRRNYIQILENLEVIKKQNSKILFKNAGVLFFSKNLDKFFPHAEVSCALFKGTEKHHNIIDRKIFNRDIINNVEDSLNFLKKHLRLEYHFPKGQLQRKEILEIPEDALREALINAVTHRNYLKEGISVTVEIFEDRVEIYNFGTLPKDLKRSDFGKRSSPRNPLIAQLMLRAKYIERMGTGIRKMRILVKKAGLKPIKFKFTTFTTLTFYRNSLSGGIIKSPEVIAVDNLSELLIEEPGIHRQNIDRMLQILFQIENETFSKNTFAIKYNIPLRSLTRYLTILKKQKLILFNGSKKKGEYKITAKYKSLKKLSKTK